MHYPFEAPPLFYVNVLFPLPFNHPFTYTTSLILKKGDVVCVPFGKKTRWGVVWEPPSSLPSQKLKEILFQSSFFRLSSSLCELIAWTASYTMAPLGMVLKLALPSLSYEIKNETLLYEIAQAPLKDFPPKHPIKKLLKLLDSHDARSLFSLKDLKHSTRLSLKALHALREEKLLIERACSYIPQTLKWPATSSTLTLSPEQEKIIDSIKKKEKKEFSVTLLEGITGSGKTEICLNLCEEIWSNKGQVLVLLPEIALAQQWEKRVQTYFKFSPSLWHSSISPSQRKKMFYALTQGTTPLIIGARSALFLPYKNLKLIIIDEEHDPLYKQEEGVLYQARDLAIVRAQKEKIPLILSSATPSLESFLNVKKQRYDYVKLTTRYGASRLPKLEIIDLRNYAKHWLSPPLKSAITQTLEKKQQALLFLNRRGHSMLLLCHQCGFRFSCPNCSAWLSAHQKNPQISHPHLLCHYCGWWKNFPTICPECHKEDCLLTYGIGVEKVQEEISAIFPQARTKIFSSDHLSSLSRIEEVIKTIRAQEIDILIGTQMIAKGHDFPLLTCIGIIDADLGLTDLDLRTNERMFHLLSQVSGRAGRSKNPGVVYLQTYQPNHPLIHDFKTENFEQFKNSELNLRKKNNWPPFANLAALILSGTNSSIVEKAANNLRKHIPNLSTIQILGPVPAPLNPLRGNYRWRFLIKAPRSIALQPIILKWLSFHSISSVNVAIDINPYTFL